MCVFWITPDHSKSCLENLNIYLCKAIDIEQDHSQSGNTPRTMNMLMSSRPKEPIHMDGSQPENYGQNYEMVASDTVLWPPRIIFLTILKLLPHKRKAHAL